MNVAALRALMEGRELMPIVERCGANDARLRVCGTLDARRRRCAICQYCDNGVPSLIQLTISDVERCECWSLPQPQGCIYSGELPDVNGVWLLFWTGNCGWATCHGSVVPRQYPVAPCVGEATEIAPVQLVIEAYRLNDFVWRVWLRTSVALNALGDTPYTATQQTQDCFTPVELVSSSVSRCCPTGAVRYRGGTMTLEALP